MFRPVFPDNACKKTWLCFLSTQNNYESEMPAGQSFCFGLLQIIFSWHSQSSLVIRLTCPVPQNGFPIQYPLSHSSSRSVILVWPFNFSSMAPMAFQRRRLRQSVSGVLLNKQLHILTIPCTYRHLTYSFTKSVCDILIPTRRIIMGFRCPVSAIHCFPGTWAAWNISVFPLLRQDAMRSTLTRFRRS